MHGIGTVDDDDDDDVTRRTNETSFSLNAMMEHTHTHTHTSFYNWHQVLHMDTSPFVSLQRRK